MDVFNCPFEIVFLELKPPLTDDQLIMMIDSLNGMVTEIRRVEIESATSSMLELFMNRFRKSIGTLVLHDSDRLVCKRLNFEIKNVFYSDSLKWINLDFLLSMDTLSISALSCNLSAKDLNVFLRSWQEGKTNQKLQHIDFMTFEQLDVMEVVKGCGGELMDPRTTKLKYQGINYAEVGFDIWIHGGIYIRRNDGRLAVIATNGHNYGGAEEIIKDIRERNYLDAWDIWNSENSAEKWNMNKFFIFIDMKED
uniref:FBA_2 domain-containing protein n=1 Tax=Caenorhabditis tropicalis TaxID=1561998 RepID=A0A1I7U1C3_9PELO